MLVDTHIKKHKIILRKRKKWNLKNPDFCHMVAALFLPPNSLLAMLTLYCDASGKKTDPIMGVSGFVASVNEWFAFDKEWQDALNRANVAYFHMSEFAHSTGQFKSWKRKELKRKHFLGQLIKIIASHARFSVSATILKSVYDGVDAIYQLHEKLQPFPLCGITCVDSALVWQEARHLEDHSMEFVFEAGDEDRGQLIHAVKELTGQEPIFRTKTQATPLQAADFSAYEQFRANKTTEVEIDKLFTRFRVPSLRLLETVPSKAGIFNNETDLRVVCRQMNIPKRI